MMVKNERGKRYVVGDWRIGENEGISYLVEFVESGNGFYEVRGVLKYKGVSIGNIALMVADERFDEILKDFGFEIIKKEVDLENGNVEFEVIRVQEDPIGVDDVDIEEKMYQLGKEFVEGFEVAILGAAAYLEYIPEKSGK